MKKYAYLVLCLVLTTAVLVGCGCTRNKETLPEPTVLPTNEEVWESTHPTTQATTEATAPSTDMTEESVPGTTADHGNGPLEDTSAATDGSIDSRTAREIPGMK